jgi:hypothetical protein
LPVSAYLATARRAASGGGRSGAGLGIVSTALPTRAWSGRINDTQPGPILRDDVNGVRCDVTAVEVHPAYAAERMGLHTLGPPPCWGCTDIVPMAPTSGGGVPSSSSPSQ